MEFFRILLFLGSFILFGMGFYYGNPGEASQDMSVAWFAFGMSATMFAMGIFLEPISEWFKEHGAESENPKPTKAKKKKLSAERSAEFADISEQNWKMGQKPD
ncbi:hypothetical protein OS189_18415 [Sulfitobacter sp. F26169L]|uniref:hypothetical protein n=1 Tax=Sulfitobacter sp. F26169L TaxID=2996015 RepID=UPI0022608561|nr:hypothetical protein [Sulfitobacter sp. F26169L]MCX7568316.1 hypothetical protein [Sulfitobacter sp. F26169L]